MVKGNLNFPSPRFKSFVFPAQIYEHAPVSEKSVKMDEEEPKPGTSKDEDFSELTEPSQSIFEISRVSRFDCLFFRRHIDRAEGTKLSFVCLGVFEQSDDQFDQLFKQIFEGLSIRGESVNKREKNTEG